MNPFRLIKNFPIRYKLLFIYSVCFMVIMALSDMAIYTIVKKTVEQNIESELKNSASAILNNVKTAVSVSIKNRLRAVAEKNYEIIARLYEQSRAGQISIEEAKARAVDIIFCQKIGTNGYICILDGSGRVLKHPKKQLEGLDISDHNFVQEMIAKKTGYIEYQWKNPDDTAPKPKALYLSYFEPWDWMITVSSYRKEFSKLVDINDFKESILSLKFGKTGYSYVMDTKGNVIIHPELTGVNVLKDHRFSNDFFLEMMKKKNGKLIYSWKNPGEKLHRKKLVAFNFIPEYEWFVACSSYLDEFYAPLQTIKNLIVIVGLAAIAVFLPVSTLVSSTITSPLQTLMKRFSQDIAAGFSNREIQMDSKDEIGQLTHYYNSFMDRLQVYDKKLQLEIKERHQTQEALKESEEKYRSVMGAVPDPIIVYDMTGKVTYLNPAFTQVFGFTLMQSLGKKMDHFVPRANWKESMDGIAAILEGNTNHLLETKRKAKDGRLIDVITRGSVYRDQDGKPLGTVIIHRDVSEVKRLEKAIMETGERERQAIGNDLHDDLCPHLIGIEGLVKVMKKKVEADFPDAGLLSDRISELIKEAISKTRRLARGLCPVYCYQGLAPSLEELAEQTRSIHRINCTLEVKSGVKMDNHMVIINLYHIAGEAVRNAVRHGKANRISILVEAASDQLTLSVADNGIGINHAKKTTGMGLRIINYRAKIIGASIIISPGKETGTIVKLSMPASPDIS